MVVKFFGLGILRIDEDYKELLIFKKKIFFFNIYLFLGQRERGRRERSGALAHPKRGLSSPDSGLEL